MLKDREICVCHLVCRLYNRQYTNFETDGHHYVNTNTNVIPNTDVYEEIPTSHFWGIASDGRTDA